MTCFNKEDYKNLKRQAKADKVYVATKELPDGTWSSGYTYGGVSVAMGDIRSNCKMITVAVSYCSSEDKYKKKHGKYHALNKFYGLETVQLPLGEHVRENGVEATLEYLLDIFTV